jgi:hypothetical protein
VGVDGLNLGVGVAILVRVVMLVRYMELPSHCHLFPVAVWQFKRVAGICEHKLFKTLILMTNAMFIMIVYSCYSDYLQALW